MTARIAVTPDMLDATAARFERGANQIHATLAGLNQAAQSVDGDWRGMSRAEFQSTWTRMRGLLDKTPENALRTGRALRDIARAFREAEQRSAVATRRNGGSGAAGGGATAGSADPQPANVQRMMSDARDAMTQDLAEAKADLAKDPTNQNLRGKVARLEKWLSDGRQIVLYDPTGDGRVAELFGDISTAKRVAVLVPGVNTDLSGFDDDGGFRDGARNLSSAAGPGVAVIAWLGYDAPGNSTAGIWGDVAGVSSNPAKDGAEALAGFVKQLDLPTGTPLSLIGHSYGSVVVGRALKDFGVQADQAIVLGSPGMDVGSAADLGRPDVKIYAGMASHDPMLLEGAAEGGLLPPGFIHGTDPWLPGFGSTVFTGDGDHNSYWAPGSDLLNQQAEILLGGYGA